ncbi:unnamed protein product [Ixodes persulcatus]
MPAQKALHTHQKTKMTTNEKRHRYRRLAACAAKKTTRATMLPFPFFPLWQAVETLVCTQSGKPLHPSFQHPVGCSSRLSRRTLAELDDRVAESTEVKGPVSA